MSNLFKIVCIAFVFVSQGFGAATQSLARANLLCKSKIIDEIEEAKNIYERLAKSNIKAAESLRIYNRNMGFFEKYIPKITLAQAHELGANPFLATAQSSFKRRLDRATKLFGGYVSHVNLLQFFTNEEETVAAVLTTDSFAAYFQKHKAEIVRGIDLVRVDKKLLIDFARFFDKQGCYRTAIKYYKRVGFHDEIKMLERIMVLFGPYAPRVRERDFEDIIIEKVLASDSFVLYFNTCKEEVIDRLNQAQISENSRRVLVEFLEKNNYQDLSLNQLNRINNIRALFGEYALQTPFKFFLPLEGELDYQVVIRIMKHPLYVDYCRSNWFRGYGNIIKYLIDQGCAETARTFPYYPLYLEKLIYIKKIFGGYFSQIKLETILNSDALDVIKSTLKQQTFIKYFNENPEEIIYCFDSVNKNNECYFLGLFMEEQGCYIQAFNHYHNYVVQRANISSEYFGVAKKKAKRFSRSYGAFHFFFPKNIQPENYFDEDIDIISFYLSNLFVPHLAQTIHDHWSLLLESSNRTNLRAIADFIEGYALYLGLEEAHPLVQTSIARLTVLNQNITDPNNPWKVWNDLHRKRGVVVDFNLLVPEHHQGTKLIAGRMVEFRPNALADLQLNVKISGVPDVKPEVLSDALNVIEAKLTPSIRTTISHMSESESFESIHARATAPYITNLLRGESVLAAQLKCLINYALSFPKGPHFNDADQQLIRLFVNIIECEVGQSEGITKLYSNIPEEFKFKILRGTLDADIDVTAAKNHLRGLINETVEELIGNENDFMKIMCGVSKISQISHQSIYLKNFIGDYVGLIWMLKFDHHAQLLYEPMLEKTKAQALALFYDYILTDNRFIQGLAYKINQAVQTKNTYDLLSVLTQSWHVLDDDDGTRQITNQGVVELLMSVGILVPSTSLFAH